MKTTINQSVVNKTINNFIVSINTKSLENYQAHEDHEDHVDSFVLKTKPDVFPCDSQLAYAKHLILKRIKDKQCPKIICESSYGEYLYGDYVESPAYDDYLEYNSGDNE